jgi:hypothetical protein
VERRGNPGRPGLAGRWIAIAAVAAAAIGVLAAAPARAALTGPGSVVDRVIPGPVPAARSGLPSLPRVQLPGGGSIQVQVDPAFAGGGALQRVLNTLAELPHGAEMNRLEVHIADLPNLYRLCGQGATACYYPASEAMIVSGSPINPNNQMPQGMVIAHEYGHHIEANRSLPGWNASDLGGRHWATYEHVCEGVGAGELFPGDQGVHYWDNPGEAFAQAYATMLYPGAVPWWWHFAEPDDGAFDAIRADVADGARVRTTRWARRLAPRSPKAVTTLTTAVDGPIQVKLRAPRTARFVVALRGADGRLLRKGRTTVKMKRRSEAPLTQLSYSACGTRSVTLEVRRRTGRGKFTARISQP